MYLKSTDPNFDPNEITESYSALYGGDPVAFFEHGQWFVWDKSTDANYSVCDAIGPPCTVCSGLSFECLG